MLSLVESLPIDRRLLRNQLRLEHRQTSSCVSSAYGSRRASKTAPWETNRRLRKLESWMKEEMALPKFAVKLSSMSEQLGALKDWRVPNTRTFS